MEMEHDFLELQDVTLHVVQSGPEDGPLLLFLHGFPEFWYSWQKQLSYFANLGYRVVAPDMRGYNESSKPSRVDSYQTHHLIEDVRQLVAEYGRSRFTLIGHDWGGVVAWAFAAAHGDMLDKLIILNAPHPAVFARELLNKPAQQKASEYITFFRSPTAEPFLEGDGYGRLLHAFVIREHNVLSAYEQELYLKAWSQPGALTGGLNYYRALHEPKRLAQMATEAPDSFTIQVPTLVIWGERDSALLAGNLEGLETYVPHLTIHRIPTASHWVVHEESDQINATIHTFLQG